MDSELRVELLLTLRQVRPELASLTQMVLNEGLVHEALRTEKVRSTSWRERVALWNQRVFRTRARALVEECRERGVRLVSPLHEEWPTGLSELPSPPWLLFVEGRPLTRTFAQPGVAIVGTRSPTGYGITVTQRFAATLARRGCAVWSGMARGIDQTAHRACLEAGGHTVAVLGSGLARPYPSSCDALFAAIRERGTLLSEFPLDQRAQRWTFPLRNRILAASVRHVLVSQAAAVSGSLITVRHALEQGATIYTVPDRIDQPMAQGTLGLLREGAVPLLHPDQLLREMGLALESRGGDTPRDPVLDLLRDGERSIDDLVTLCELPIGEILRRLSRGEAEGRVSRTPTGRYRAT